MRVKLETKKIRCVLIPSDITYAFEKKIFKNRTANDGERFYFFALYGVLCSMEKVETRVP